MITEKRSRKGRSKDRRGIKRGINRWGSPDRGKAAVGDCTKMYGAGLGGIYVGWGV
jgi:hypothetical protein